MTSTNTVTRRLVYANVAVFATLWLVGASLEAVYAAWGLVPGRFLAEFGAREVATVFTSMFLHGGVWHLLGNVIFLWFFGRLVETRLGSARFLTLYLIAGAGAALAQIAMDPGSVIPMVGASGAISGALGAALILAPRERVVLFTPFTLFIPITMSIATFAGIWVLLQVFGILGGPMTGGIAFMAHLGGFFTGWLLTRRAVPMNGAKRRTAGPEARRRRPRMGAARRSGPSSAVPGASPGTRYRTIFVTDARGRTFAFHEPNEA